jgi:hypothetical protein
VRRVYVSVVLHFVDIVVDVLPPPSPLLLLLIFVLVFFLLLLLVIIVVKLLLIFPKHRLHVFREVMSTLFFIRTVWVYVHAVVVSQQMVVLTQQTISFLHGRRMQIPSCIA